MGLPVGTHLKIMTLLSCESFNKLQFCRKGRGPLNPSPIYDGLLSGLLLYRPSAGDHHECKFIASKEVSLPEENI